MDELSGVLFARPSFFEGIARILDFGNTLSQYNDPPGSEEADYYAIRADWQVIGQDIERAARGVDHFVDTNKMVLSKSRGR